MVDFSHDHGGNFFEMKGIGGFIDHDRTFSQDLSHFSRLRLWRSLTLFHDQHKLFTFLLKLFLLFWWGHFHRSRKIKVLRSTSRSHFLKRSSLTPPPHKNLKTLNQISNPLKQPFHSLSPNYSIINSSIYLYITIFRRL